MPFWDITLISKQELGGNLKAFHFAKPEGFTFKAGQYGGIKFDLPEDGHIEDYFKSFTIASSPFDDDLMIVTRIRDSDFKRLLDAVPIGGSLRWDAPYGNFLLKHRPAVFIANGLGVTPAHSMIRQAVHDCLDIPITLIHLNKRPEGQVLAEVFEQLADANPTVLYISHLRPEGWLGENNAEALNQVIEQSVSNFEQSMFYLAGGYPFVLASKKALLSLIVDPSQIKQDEFAGY